MTKTAEAGKKRSVVTFFGALGLALGLPLTVAFVGAVRDRMRSQRDWLEREQRERQVEYRQELSLNLWGYGLALGLTLIPFALVYWSVLPAYWLLIAIGAFAFVQIVVHFRFFLLINLSKQKKEDLQLILFSSLIILLMAGGTIWILGNLATRMH